MVRMVLELNYSKPYSIPTAMVKNSPGAGSEVYFLSVCAIFQPPSQPVVKYQAVPILIEHSKYLNIVLQINGKVP